MDLEKHLAQRKKMRKAGTKVERKIGQELQRRYIKPEQATQRAKSLTKRYVKKG